jgi:hypothetical protein
MHALIRRLLTVAATLAVGSSAVGQTTPLLNEQEYSGFLAKPAVWFNSSNSGMSLANDGKLTVTAGIHALTYFTSPGYPQILGVGAELSASFDLSFQSVGTTGQGFRVGVFDSMGTPISPNRATADNQPGIFQNYEGYVWTWKPNPGTGSNGLSLNERDSGFVGTNSTRLLSTITNVYTTVGSGNGPSAQVFQTGLTYQATYSVTRTTDTTLKFDLTIAGGGPGWSFGKSYNITNPSTYSFDAFAILSVSGAGGSNFSIDNLLITHTAAASPPSDPGISANNTGGGPAIPEPSTYAACAGAAVLGLAFWRRRRAAAKAVVA